MNTKLVTSLVFLLAAFSRGNLFVSAQSDVTFEEVKALKDNTTVLLVDVRQPNELVETGVIPGSINIPLDTLEDVLKNLPAEEFEARFQREKPNFETIIVFTCRSGNRSRQAQNIALNLGFVNSKNYPGGWLEWEVKIKE